MMPFFHFFHISGAGNWSNTVRKNVSQWKIPHGVTCSCGVGVGVSDSFCINLTNIISSEQWYDALFSIFLIFQELVIVIENRPRNWNWKCLVAENVLGLENASLLKKMQPRVSLIGKLLVPQNVSWWKIPHGGKYLVVQRSCNRCQKVKKDIT